MAVMLSTSCGSLVIDLFTTECPRACENFLKLCKVKYYHGCLFWSVEKNFIAQTGDPTGTGKGGSSIWGLMDSSKKSFEKEINPKRTIDRVGLVCMVHANETSNRSQFFLTLRPDRLEHMKGSVTVIGEVAEGISTLKKINDLYCDADGRPYQDVRILHTDILDDPYPDPQWLARLVPAASPVSKDKFNPFISPTEQVRRRIPYEKNLVECINETATDRIETVKREEASSRAMVLEMVGDLPDANVKPPDEVLFVCKLNAVTTDEDLELIFSRFGNIKDCTIVRDPVTEKSLQYAFIEFAEEKSCLLAYEKMNNVLIDDRRIKVDFSQSVAQEWNKFRLRKMKGPRVAISKKRSRSPDRH